MIQFFRKIRYNQMSEKKMGKYFKYAIGEILLVVIGILIALQINNWNQKQNDREYELTMLAQVREQLKKDFQSCKATLPYFEGVSDDIKEVVKIKNDINYPADSLQIYLNRINSFGITYSFNTSAFDGIESGGLDKITNPEIRDLLSDLYGNSIPTASEWLNEIIRDALFERSKLIYEIFEPRVVTGLDGSIQTELVVDDSALIRNNPKFDEMIASFNWPIPIAIGIIKNLLVKMERLQELINNELDK